QSGLMLGDEIIRVDGARVHVAEELSYEIMHNAIEPIDIVVRRNGEVVTVEDVTFPTTVIEGVLFGLPDFYVEADAKNLGGVVKHTFFRSISTVKMIWESLVDLITGRYGIGAVSGPVGVATAVSDAAKSGINSVINLVVIIAMNLGVFNLLPLPALDGGRLLFQIIELVRRKPLKPEFEGYVHFVGIVILMALMIAVTFKDIIKIFT
ncbi:MAG: site-2 protease family protein, partial [Clostridia bacterium]|nr:site-2 protease family protein [Clostridia bacterium]